MQFEWDAGKDRINQRKHGLSFTDAKALFESGVDYLEIFDTGSQKRATFESSALDWPPDANKNSSTRTGTNFDDGHSRTDG